MKLITSNIRSKPAMRQSKVEADTKRVKTLGGIIGWQEIHDQRYKDAVLLAGEHGDWEDVNLQLSVPISVRADYYRVVKHGYRQVHKARAFVTPARYLSWALVERLSTQQKVVVINTHFISDAWGSTPTTFRRWRQRMWNLHYAALKELVEGFHGQGFTILGVGDYNRRQVADLHPQMVWVQNTGVDKIWYLDGRSGPRVESTGEVASYAGNTDHLIRVAPLRLFRRS